MNRKPLYFKLLAMLLCAAFLVACGTNAAPQTGTGTQSSSNSIAGKDANELISKLVTYDSDDYYTDWKTKIQIILN